MSILRYDPFRDLRSLQEEVNRLFSTNLTRGFGEEEEGIGRGAWNPSVDIYENKDQIVLEAELPGMNRMTSNLRSKTTSSLFVASVSLRRRTKLTTTIAWSALMAHSPVPLPCRRLFQRKEQLPNIEVGCCA